MARIGSLHRPVTMVLMLPTATDNGARLAAILPTGLASLARGLGEDPAETLAAALGSAEVPSALPAVRSLVLVVVDGLGHANLRAMRAHARTLSALPGRRIETVIPSTTGAALTTLTTGRLPGEHGLIGYRIRHPELGLVSTLKEWQGIEDRTAWQRCAPLFGHARGIGARAVAIGRPAHAVGGLTETILAGTEYLGGQTVSDRFSIASRLLRGGDPILAYLYVDELDRVGHSDGWQSPAWLRRLEELDSALEGFLRTLPGGVGVVITADHGMIDVPPERRVQLDADADALLGVREIGGEPRMRSLYLHEGAEVTEVAERVAASLARSAWVVTRDQAIDAGWFGPVDPAVAPRLGEVLVVARGEFAFTLGADGPAAQAMVGQHGGLSAEERGVPLSLGGALEGTGFAAAVADTARPLSL